MQRFILSPRYPSSLKEEMGNSPILSAGGGPMKESFLNPENIKSRKNIPVRNLNELSFIIEISLTES
jgi:hypothetical protein